MNSINPSQTVVELDYFTEYINDYNNLIKDMGMRQYYITFKFESDFETPNRNRHQDTLRLVSPAPVKPKKSTVHFTTTCSVCLEDFGQEKISSTECGHLFHSKCLETALVTKKKCPNCRAVVE